MADAGQWYNQLPRFTRYWLTCTVVASLVVRFDIVPMNLVYLSRNDVFGNFQIWRCITALFVYPLYGSSGFHFLINCFYISRYIAQLEKEQFGRSPADYLYMILIVSLLANIGGLLFNVFFLMDALVVSTTYIWCQLNKDVIINFWFGMRFKAIYLPWVLGCIELIFQGSLASLIGVFIGHVYYFFKFQYPQELGGNAFLETPFLIKQYVPDVSGGFSGFGEPPVSRAPPRQAPGNPYVGNTWGRGNQLGR